MPNVLPQLLRTMTERAYSPPIAMYLRMLLGTGKPMTKLPPALEKNLANLNLSGQGGDEFEDWALRRYGTFDANPHNLGYSDYGEDEDSPDIGGLRAREMSSQTSPLMTMRSLGSFRATPVGRDSVSISDNYDFDNDTQGENPVYTAPYIKFAQKWGAPYQVSARISAPKLNAQLRARESSFTAARKRAQKQMIDDLAQILGGGK